LLEKLREMERGAPAQKNRSSGIFERLKEAFTHPEE
jgi:hypothetical protein